MSAVFQQSLQALIKSGEGSIDHMYLDTVGKVTVGVGNMLPNAEAAIALGFLQRSDDAPASADQIGQEYEGIFCRMPGQYAASYRPYTNLYLPEEAINNLLDTRIGDFQAGLEKSFPNYPGYPEAVKQALMDMAFNLGNAGLVKKFPSLTKAARNEDWSECAAQCHRRGISASRNEEVEGLFLQAV